MIATWHIRHRRFDDLLLASSSEMSRPSAPPPSRAMGRSQVCIMLILAVGFVLILSYQFQIHTVVGGEGRRLGRYRILGVSESNSSSEEALVTEGEQQQDDNVGTKPSSTSGEKIEVVSSNSTSRKSKKKNWKDQKTEAFMPLVDSVQSNTVSSKFQIVIKVLALNNYDSLVRCLSSLSNAEYSGDMVDIHVYIDHFEISQGVRRRRLLLASEEGMDTKSSSKEGLETSPPLKNREAEETQTMQESNTSSGTTRELKEGGFDGSEAAAAHMPDRVESGEDSVKLSDWSLIEERLDEARSVLNHAESFVWRHGKKVIHYSTRKTGSQSQWLDAWWPSSDDEFALFVEDDAELSPLFYRYARSLIATYYYQPSHFDRSLYGISLQRPQIVPGKNGRPLKVDDRTRLFKYQMVGMWGQIFFPKPWKEFREWFDSKKSYGGKPVVDGMVTTDWYKQHGEKTFTPWFVKFAYNRGYFNLYTNFLRDRVLSVTHRNFWGKPKEYQGCDSVLIWENGTYDIDLWHMAATWHVKRYDFCFKEVRAGRFANYSSDLSWVLDSTQVNKQILMVSIMGVPEVLVRNWLCTVRKLGIENYLLVGEDPALLEDLARRGHATMRFENKQNLKENKDKEASAVLDVLGFGYDLWFTRADTIWVGNPLVLVDTLGADVIGMENLELNLFFIRSTNLTTLLWESLKQDLSKALLANASIASSWQEAKANFVKACEKEQNIRMRKLENVMFIDWEQQLSQDPTTLEGSGGSVDGQVLVLTNLQSSSDDEVKTKIELLRLWNLNDDLACAKLTC